MRIGYQIYSARDEAERDLAGVLGQLKAMGYDGVEFAGFYGHTAADVKAMLDEAGLVAISSHVPFAVIEQDMFGTIAFHQAIGCRYIAIPYLDEQTRPGGVGFARVLQQIYRFGALCAEAGIGLLYHNHDFEFVQVSGQYGLDFLYDCVPARILATELDTCWIRVAGESPVAYIEKYAGRCPIVHLKDFVGGKKQGEKLYALIKAEGKDDDPSVQSTAFDFRPVGYGVQDFPAITKAAVAAGASWFIVEQDRSSERAPLEAARMSRAYLQSIGF